MIKQEGLSMPFIAFLIASFIGVGYMTIFHGRIEGLSREAIDSIKEGAHGHPADAVWTMTLYLPQLKCTSIGESIAERVMVEGDVVSFYSGEDCMHKDKYAEVQKGESRWANPTRLLINEGDHIRLLEFNK